MILLGGEESKKMRTIIKHHVIFLMLLALLLIIVGKVYFKTSPNVFLLIYGITTTTTIFIMMLLAYTRYRDPYESISKRRLNNLKKPFISCVLAVKNEEEIIIECVNSLLNSTYKNKEIIVVNDASTDRTKEVLDKEFGNNNKVKIIHLIENIGKKRAIGKGLRIAKGEIFVFTDSDSIVAPDAIERIIAVFMNDPKVGAVSGHGRALNVNKNIYTKIQDTWYETQFSIKKALESIDNAVTCVSGPLAVFRKKAIYNYIPAWEQDTFLWEEFRFATDRQLTGYVLGSKYIGKKLKAKYAGSEFIKGTNYRVRNWKVIYCKSAKVWTIVPDTFSKMIKQHVRWKKSFIRNLFFTGKFYWRKPIIPALKYYIGAFFTIAGPFVAFRHIIYLPYNGNLLSGMYYLSGIMFIGLIYGLYFKLEEPQSRIWIYRPLMSLFSTTILSWLIFYSAATIKNKIWHRG